MHTDETPDTPTPEQMRREVHTFVDGLDEETLEALWRMLTAIYGPSMPWWGKDGGDRGAVP
jgi:hypothetical protein